jgi:hypothetical protein
MLLCTCNKMYTMGQIHVIDKSLQSANLSKIDIVQKYCDTLPKKPAYSEARC